MAGTNLGTAWIQIKPSMKGMTSSIRSELSGVGESEGQKVGSSFTTGFAAKIGAVSAITERVFSSAISTITNQISDAVYRADTLNRFPKVMEQMGYGADEASAAILKLRDGVAGIPTSLADVVSGTQRLVTVTGDVQKAADWTLAISDAMISNGASTETAKSAMEQFMQVLARGKPYGQDWQSILVAAPGTMDKLAKSLGYTSAAVEGDFYMALQKGTLSIDDMMAALVNLDQNGTDSFTSLHELAKTSTSGIENTITNLRQSISNAIVDIIQSIGSENIEAAITKIKEVILGLIDVIKNLIMWAKDNWGWLQNVGKAVLGFFAGATVLKWIMKVKNAFTGLGTTIKGIFGNKAVQEVTKGTEKVFSGIGTGIKNALGTIKDILSGVVNAVMEPIKAIFKGVGEALAGFFKALADPTIALGAAMFAIAAASIAAAILMIGGAIGVVLPALTDLFNNIIMPIAEFIRDTVLTLIDHLTQSIIILTQNALIPLGTFMVESFVTILNTVTDAVTRLTQNALVPLINTLSGAFTNILNAVANLLTGIIKSALEGVANVVRALGDGFVKMGEAIKLALDGVSGVLNAFADLIRSIASAAVAIVALVTGHSIDYGNGFAHLDGYALGGRVFGEGSSTSDSIPALLSNGEYVIKASTAQKIGYDNLDELNETGGMSTGQTNYFTINGYNKSPEELATIISRKIAFNTQGVIG